MLLLVFLGFSGFCDCSFRPCFNLVDRLEKTYSTDFYASVAYTSGAEVLGPIPTEGALPFAASDKAGAQLSYQGGEAMSVVRHYHQGRGATQPPPTGSSLRGRQDPESSGNTEA